jgi:quercetin dioxygenase-like cupin family protein
MSLRFLAVAALLQLGLTTGAAAQPGVAYVPRDKVDAALANGGVMFERPQLRVAGGHRDKPGALATEKGTTILYVTRGEGTFVAGAQSRRLTAGDVIVVPAGTSQSFTSVSPSISYYQVVVPVLAKDAKAELVHVGRDKVAPTLKKAAPVADGPNLRVSGGFRNGPYVPADNRPVVEIHENEGDLFYVIEGRSTQVLGGQVIGGKQTGPGQIRGASIEGGQQYPLAKGDVMWVPAGTPHWFPEMPEALSYLLVKVFY